MTVAVQQYMFGLKPKMQGLEIKPCIPDVWKNVKVKRVFRDTEYDITIDNSAKMGNTVKCIYVDGKPIEGNIVAPNGKKLNVLVVMGG